MDGAQRFYIQVVSVGVNKQFVEKIFINIVEEATYI